MIERKKNCERLKIGRRNNCIVNLITTGLIGLHKGPKKIRSTSKTYTLLGQNAILKTSVFPNEPLENKG